MKKWFGALTLLVGCNTNGNSGIITRNDSGLNSNADADPPVITCDQITDAQTLGEDVPIACNITDDGSGVFLVQVKFKEETSITWDDASMHSVDNAGNYEGDIPGKKVASAGMDWYVEATDGADNTADMPADGSDDPYHFRVSE